MPIKIEQGRFLFAFGLLASKWFQCDRCSSVSDTFYYKAIILLYECV